MIGALLAVFVVIACAGGAYAAATVAVRRPSAAAGRGANTLESPIPGVDDSSWTVYVMRLRGGRRPNTVTADGRMGAFGFTARELADVGLMENPRKGPSGVWLGVWAPGLDLRAFLEDSRMQYWALRELTQQHVAVISDNYAECFGMIIEGQPVSLSGLLAGARKAGLSGLRSWVEDATARQRHAHTTAMVRRFSTIF